MAQGPVGFVLGVIFCLSISAIKKIAEKIKREKAERQDAEEIERQWRVG